MATDSKDKAETKPHVNGVKLDRIPIAFQVGDTAIDGAVIRPLNYKGLSDLVAEAATMKTPTAWEARMRRLRLTRQVAYYSNGSACPVSMEDVLKLSIPDARKIIAQLDENEGKAGKIVRDGDGIDQAVVYELGTPIPTGAGKPPITELEFHASNYGDVEDVLAAENTLQQTSMLLARVAKPIHPTLQLLPDAMINFITVADGVTISREILPRFTGSPDE